MLFHVALSVANMNLSRRFTWVVKRIWRTECETDIVNTVADSLFWFIQFSLLQFNLNFFHYWCATDLCIDRLSHILAIVMKIQASGAAWACDTKSGWPFFSDCRNNQTCFKPGLWSKSGETVVWDNSKRQDSLKQEKNLCIGRNVASKLP